VHGFGFGKHRMMLIAALTRLREQKTVMFYTTLSEVRIHLELRAMGATKEELKYLQVKSV
jgi:hypothetical protein